MFNKRQRDGLAKVCDTVGAALLIALAVNVVINHDVGWLQAVILGILGVACVAVAFALRKGD